MRVDLKAHLFHIKRCVCKRTVGHIRRGITLRNYFAPALSDLTLMATRDFREQ
jgi:hypothetical protein